MPEPVRMKMENSFGQDFSQVQIHESSKASELGALAYTQGKEIHFAPGQSNPESQKGQELLGHELTHVVQQQQGKVKPTTQLKGTHINDDSSLEKEADQMGKMAAEGKSIGTNQSHGAETSNDLQKQDDKTSANPDGLHNLQDKYQVLINDLNNGKDKFQENCLGWGIVNRSIGSKYAQAYKNHEDVVKDNNAYKEDLKAVFTSVVSVVGAGAFSWVSTTGFMAARLAALKIPNADAIANIGEDVLQAGWDKASPLAGKVVDFNSGGSSQSTSGEIPLVFQNELLNKADKSNLSILSVIRENSENVNNIKRQLTIINSGKVSAEVLARENQRYSTIEGVINNAVSAINTFCSTNKAPTPDYSLIQKEFEKGIWAMWLPKLKTVEKRHIPHYDEFGVRDPNGGSYNVDVYETWLSGSLKGKLKELNIEAESGSEIEYWTSEEDVKKLIAWAQSYKPKKLI
jgi:hypothetical protein